MATSFKEKTAKYYLNAQGEFVIENYNFAKPFANFFPGIAGKYGIPMWVFYVNRGQAISSFGTRDKDHAILEFFPANRSWQFTSTLGFRTFLKINPSKESVFYEPFHNGFSSAHFDLKNKMCISSSELTIEEINSTLGLKTKVEYFNIPDDSYAGLTRKVTLTNTGRKTKKIQTLDGLAQIVPFGTANLFLKKLSRTIEAWMTVRNLEKGAAFYKLDVDPTDRPEIIHITEGNFYLSFCQEGSKRKIIPPIVDAETIFGQATDFSLPYRFLENKNYRPAKGITNSKTPCGFTLLDLELKPGEEMSFFTVIGYTRSLEALNSHVVKIINADYLAQKKEENKKIISQLQNDIETKSSSPAFDLYAKQTYLDNILRGGYPTLFKQTVFYLYSRKHGDLERDYNKFSIAPTYFSQGNGNYRDINQNRRCDIWFTPEVKDEGLIYFLNLLQTDGYNPLVVKGVNFILKNEQGFKTAAAKLIKERDLEKLGDFLKKPFTPGDVILFVQENNIALNPSSYDEFLDILLSNSLKQQEAEHGEGFWTDHWAYNLDLLENYLDFYPEELKEMAFDKKVFTYFDNTEVVRPRAEKYMLYNGLPRQLHSVTADNAKKELIRKRSDQPHLVRSEHGHGAIYQTTLINKLLCLAANKLSSLDPFGVGIEMEANKPNWYDALNGLPALFGSSLCETLELKRLLLFIKNALACTGVQSIQLTEEVHGFLTGLSGILENDNLQYWEESAKLKEDYRAKTHLGVSGKESEISTQDLTSILDRAIKKVGAGIARAFDKKKGVYYSYFINEVVEYEVIKDSLIKPKTFQQKPLPFFLEGQMHALRLAKDTKEAQSLHQATKKSELFDKELRMYKVTASLKNMPEEIGRCRVFSPGWLEHESVWLHMEYKYLLEILKQGLFEEFYVDFRNALIPFQKPLRYGRNILENSSFLVSSAFSDKKLHGNGFVARLSGSTAEFIQIWLLMNLGKHPFFLDKNNALNLRLQPALAGWLFDKKGLYSFNFLSKIRVNYYNPKRKDTFGKNAARIKRIILQDHKGKFTEITAPIIPSPYAEQVRTRLIKQIDVYLE
ncbi:MAG: cellobiose phosphorylase [Candidatus Omnitrophica bacterium]|nr:cellobiose phosphorylase [Candidatus Omnitrophota bacterium]